MVTRLTLYCTLASHYTQEGFGFSSCHWGLEAAWQGSSYINDLVLQTFSHSEAVRNVKSASGMFAADATVTKKEGSAGSVRTEDLAAKQHEQ